MFALLYRLFGTLTVACTDGFVGRFLDLCRESGIVLRQVRPREGGVTAELTPEEFFRLRYVARDSGMRVKILRKRGLVPVVLRYRRRYGLLIGAVLFLLIQFSLSGHVWQIDLLAESGRYTEEQILSALREEGLFIGAKRQDVDADKTENAVLSALPDLKRMAISLRHGRATVELTDRENAPGEGQEEEPPIPSNVVASADGFIVSVYPYAGEAAVKPGDTVRKGQLLISGVYDGAFDRTYLTVARGKVIAQTKRETSFVLERTTEETTLTGREKTDIHLFFFGIKINFCPSGRNPYDKCDIIEETYTLTVFGKTLPVSLKTATHRQQTSTPRLLSEEELKSRGRQMVQTYEERELQNVTVLSRQVRLQGGEDEVTVHIDYVCEENIGVTVSTGNGENDFGRETHQYGTDGTTDGTVW